MRKQVIIELTRDNLIESIKEIELIIRIISSIESINLKQSE